jgi:hypothetical protein
VVERAGYYKDRITLIGFAYVSFFRQRSMKNEGRDRQTRRRQNHDEISHDFTGLMVEIWERLKIAETQVALPLHRMSRWRLTTER